MKVIINSNQVDKKGKQAMNHINEHVCPMKVWLRVLKSIQWDTYDQVDQVVDATYAFYYEKRLKRISVL